MTAPESLRDDIAAIIADWRRADLKFAERADRAAIASLRRLAATAQPAGIDIAEALAIDAYRRLRNRVAPCLDAADARPRLFDERLACAASVLAAVRESATGRLGRALGFAPAGGDRRTYSELRFKRLIRMNEPEALLRDGHRIVRILDQKAPVAELARLLLFWDRRETRRLAFDYYNVPQFAPADAAPATDSE